MVPDLFRIGRCQNYQRRSGVAALHSDGRVLPEWSAAHVDWLVCAAFAALVPRGDSLRNPGVGIGVGVDAVSAQALADHLLFRRDAVADWRDPYGELCISELSGFGVRHLFVG